MPDHRYGASPQTIGVLLSTTSPKIEVPEWQRSYSWGEREIETFWQDLLAFDARYTGENINGRDYFLGSIVLVTGGPTKLLLDGQQRLATATILLSALREARRNYDTDAAARLQSKYICDFDDAANKTMPVLTLNAYDRDFFRSEIQDSSAFPRSPPTLRSHALIRKARAYFDDQIAVRGAELEDGGDAYAWILRIGLVLCDHMSVVAVTSSDEDDAAAVFETLNDRGIGLSTPDLLRNLLLRRAPIEDRERIVDEWQQVLSIHEETSVDEYLRHYWVSHRGDVKARKLYREIKDTVLNEKMDSTQLSIDLAETASVYRDIASANADSPTLARTLESMRALGAKVLYPALLSGYAAWDAGQDITKLEMFSRTLLTLYVRYNVIAGRETTILESRVYEVASDLRESQDFDEATSQLTSLAPSASEFLEQFCVASVSRMATARYLLRSIEHAKRATEELAVQGTDRVHVEHIYPKSPASNKWSNHSAMINRLGNLTLLGRRLNTSIKNADFHTKRTAYDKSEIVLTKELIKIDVWDADAVDERQRALSQYAFDLWHLPGEERPILAEGEPETNDDTPAGNTPHEEQRSVNLAQLPEVPTG